MSLGVQKHLSEVTSCLLVYGYYYIYASSSINDDNGDDELFDIRQVQLIFASPKDGMSEMVSHAFLTDIWVNNMCQGCYAMVRFRFEPMILHLHNKTPTTTPLHPVDINIQEKINVNN